MAGVTENIAAKKVETLPRKLQWQKNWDEFYEHEKKPVTENKF